MPVARKYNRQAQTAALPGARLTAAETAESLGARSGQRSQAIARLGATAANIGIDAYTRIAASERKKADDLALLDASNKLDTWELDTLHDPQHGALNTQGQASFDLPEKIDEQFMQVTGDIEKGLATPEQKLAFQKMKAERHGNIAISVRRHVAGEMQTYRANTLKATVQYAQSLAITNALDPRRVGEEMQKGVDAIRLHAPELGVTGEALDQQVRDFQSSVHVGVINNLLANEQTKKARIYYEEKKGEIAGDQQDAMEKMIRAGTVKGDAQQATAKILAEGGTLTEQRAKAKAIDDPDVQDEVLQRIEHEDAVRENVKRQGDRELLRGVYDTIDKTKNVASIPANIWAQMDGSDRSAAREYAHRLAKGEPIETDQQTYYALMQQAMDDPATFAKLNMLKARPRLSDQDFQELTRLQLSFTNEARSAEARGQTERLLDGFRTRKEIVDNTLVQYGMDPNAKPDTPQAKANAELRRMVDRRVDAAQAPDTSGKKREVSNSEIQAVVDDILSQNESIPGSWRALYNPFGYDLADKTKRLVDYTINDIPAADRQQIEAALRRTQMPISDQTILDTYIEGQLRRRAR